MTKQKILIVGDSFAADHTVSDQQAVGWCNFLAQDHNVKNCARAGVSEYKILQQLQKEDLSQYDLIIVSHTSPNRLYIDQHPSYTSNVLYNNADLIYNDVVYHHRNDPNNKILSAAKDYFEHVFDLQYHEDIYFLIRDRIQQLTQPYKCLHLFTLFDKNYQQFDSALNLKQRFKFKQGQDNHYSVQDNMDIYYLITDWINK